MSSEIEIAVEIVYMTDKAVKVFDGSKEVWLPRGMITDYTGELDIGEEITIFLSEYNATQKGLI